MAPIPWINPEEILRAAIITVLMNIPTVSLSGCVRAQNTPTSPITNVFNISLLPSLLLLEAVELPLG